MGKMGEFAQAFRSHLTAYLFVTPAVIGLVLFLVIPMVSGLFISLQSYRGFGPPQWVGFGNYVTIFKDPAFWNTLRVTVIYLVLSIMFQLPIGLMVALLIHRVSKLKYLFSGLILLPYMVPPIAAGVMWFWSLNSSYGGLTIALNSLLGLLGFDQVVRPLTDGFWPVISISLVQGWKNFGYCTIIYLAALEAIPQDLYDAASTDGATPLRQFWHITVPFLKVSTIIVLSIRTVWTLTKFAEVLELTGGGPGSQTNVLALALYRTGFQYFRLGRAYVIGISMIAIGIIATILYSRMLKPGEWLEQ